MNTQTISKTAKIETVVFDNGGTEQGGTMDRYTIVSKSGEVYGCNTEPFHGIGQYCGHVIELRVERWQTKPGLIGKQRQWIPKAVRKHRAEFIQEAINNPEGIGTMVEDLDSLPVEVKKFIEQIEAN
jgi:hypothetical protein